MTLLISPQPAELEYQAEDVIMALQKPLAERWTGRIMAFPSRIKIHIHEGHVSAVEGHTPLGDVLVNLKVLTQHQLTKLLAGSGRLGDQAIKEGHLTEQQIQQALRVQAEEALDFLTDHPPTLYQFRAREKLPVPHARLNLGNLAQRKSDSLALLPMEQMFRLARHPGPAILDEDQWELVRWFNGRRTLGRAIEMCHIDPRRGYQAASRLLSDGFIEPSAIEGFRVIVAKLKPATSLRQPPASIRANLFIKHLDGTTTIQQLVERLHYPTEEAALMLTSLYRDEVIDILQGEYEMTQLLEEF